MRVLLTNDDGIQAPGLRALAEALSSAGHTVLVCAPDRERSAASHSIMLGTTLRGVPVDYPGAEQAWQVNGTPSDCASLGLWLTREAPADLVISGINRGMNMGGACVYSGTVAAAIEAAMCGAQAMAVSLVWMPGQPEDYAAAARLAVHVAEWAVRHPLPLGVIYNLNVPDIPYGDIRGLVPAKLDPVFMGQPCYEPVGDDGYRFISNGPLELGADGDVTLSKAGYATITKLTWDMRLCTDDGELAEIGL